MHMLPALFLPISAVVANWNTLHSRLEHRHNSIKAPSTLTSNGAVYYFPRFYVDEEFENGFQAVVDPLQEGNDGSITISVACVEKSCSQKIVVGYDYPDNKTAYNITGLESGRYYVLCLDYVITTDGNRFEGTTCKIDVTMDQDGEHLSDYIPSVEFWREGSNVTANVTYVRVPLKITVKIGAKSSDCMTDGSEGSELVHLGEVEHAAYPHRVCWSWEVNAEKLSLSDKQKKYGFRWSEVCMDDTVIPERHHGGGGAASQTVASLWAVLALGLLLLVQTG